MGLRIRGDYGLFAGYGLQDYGLQSVPISLAERGLRIVGRWRSEWFVLVVALAASAGSADYIGSNVVGKRRVTECRVVLVALTSFRDSIGISKGSSADYGLRDHGFVRIADCVRISGGYGLQDYGLF